MQAAVCHDYVCAEYRGSYRGGENFIGSDCLPVDCDNDHSENPADWITPEDVAAAFPGVSFAVHYSRHHMREKNGKPARPKFHVLFPIEVMYDSAAYADMKKLTSSIFPYFDTNALYAARFFYGTGEARVELFPGEMTLTEFLEGGDEFDADMENRQHGDRTIPEGSLSRSESNNLTAALTKLGWTRQEKKERVKLYGPQVVFVPEGVPD